MDAWAASTARPDGLAAAASPASSETRSTAADSSNSSSGSSSSSTAALGCPGLAGGAAMSQRPLSSRRHRCQQRRQARLPWPLVTAAALLLLLLGSPAAEAAKCSKYRASGCHFTIRHEEPVLYPACLSQCKFQVDKELECPFYSAGLFVTEEREECPDNFMAETERQLPDCNSHCCRLQQSTGAFLPKAAPGQPGRLHFQPDGGASCRFEQYTRAEMLAGLQGRPASAAGDAHPGMDILVLGDSVMRQLYSRLVHMLRGHNRVFDYKMHTHAAYSICREGDSFKTAPYNGNRTVLGGRIDDAYLADIVPDFFRGGNNIEPGLLCSQHAAAINYAHAPTFADQAAVLERYWPAVTPGRHPVLVMSVGFWEKSAEVPEEYLTMLTELGQKVERIIFVGLPTRRVVNEEWRSAYRARNSAMAAWAAAAGPRAEFLDFDAMAHAPGTPPAGADGNWHYSCFLQWPSWRNKKLESLPGNYFRDRLYGHPIEGLVLTEDGECGDEMNRNLWNMIFNVLLGDRGVPAKPDTLAALDAGATTASEDAVSRRRSSRRALLR